MVSPLLSPVWQHIKLSDISRGTCPQDSLLVDKDVKKPNKQINGEKKNISCNDFPQGG